MDMAGRRQLMVIGSFEWSISQKCASSLILTLSRSNFKTQQSPAAILDLWLSKTRAGQFYGYRNLIDFLKLRL